MKNKFDRAGIFEFLKSFVKLLIYAITLFLFLKGRLPQLMQTMAFEPAISTSIMLRTTLDFVAVVLMISVAIGGIDYIWQVSNHRRKNRMSRQEMTDESKMSDGDPHMKQQRRQRGYDLAMNHMLAEVPKADVVIVNPTHYAVALSWRRERHTAPECVAKGVDELAARIRQAAMEAGVPIHSDPATARGLYATVELGDQIDPRYYRAVASAIRFAESMRKRARERSGR